MALLLMLSGLAVLASPADAYDPVGAKNYANQYALSRNFSYPSFSSDCTNFVSQSMHAGGYSFVGGSSETSMYQWWIRPNIWPPTWDYSTTWTVAPHLYQFLINDYPGGYPQGTAPGSSTSYWTPDAVVTGDVLFYNWGKGEGMSHANMQVGWGDDPNSTLNGNFVDQHSNDRYHAFWSLRPYNPYWASTTVYFMHIAANNY